MDTLSQLLDGIRLRGAEFLQVGLTAPWALRLCSTSSVCFHIVAAGEAWLIAGDEPPQLLRAGDMVALAIGTPHRLQSMRTLSPVAFDLLPAIDDPGQREFTVDGAEDAMKTHIVSGYFKFDIDLARPLVQALPKVFVVRGQDGRPKPWLDIGLQFVANEIAAERPAQQALVNRMADILFIEMMREYIEQLNTDTDNWLLAVRDTALSAALSAMHANPGYSWTVPRLAELACMSRSAFSDRFRRVVGQTPLAYLTSHRMRLASWQLRNTRQPIITIADTVGYQSDAAFSQAFKRETGQTPSEYRRQQVRAPAGW